jgi:hypothetical protein
MVNMMSKFKMNLLYFTEDSKKTGLLDSYCSDRNINIKPINNLSKELTLFSYTASRKEARDIFYANRREAKVKEFLLDLSSYSGEDISSIFIFASEMFWSDNSNREFSEIYKE